MKPAFHLPCVLAVLACLLAGCGQKGPLYLPAKPAQISRPATNSQPPAPSTPPAADPAPASR